MAIFLLIVAPVTTAAIIGIGGWLLRDQLGLFRSRQNRLTGERLAVVEAQLKELQERSVSPPPGASPVDTESLVAQATPRTERLLGEAIELQRQHKERDAIERLLTAYDMDLPAEAKIQLHILAGNGFLRLSELEKAEGHYRQALDASQAAQNREGEAAALGNLGIVYGQRGDPNHAEQCFRDSLAIHRELGNRRGEANQLGNLGIICKDRGDLDRAEQYHQDALAIDWEIGYRLGESNRLGNLANVYYLRGDLDRAEQHLQEALVIDRVIGNRLGEAHDLGNLGNVYLTRGNLDLAERQYQDTLAIARELSSRLSEALALGNLGLVADRLGRHGDACRLLGQASAMYDEIGAGGQGPGIVRAKLKELGCE
jgi:tetratricopeptide (TPR) repeat protein